MSSKPAAEAKRPRGRPPKPMPRIDASLEAVARAMFSAVKKPDPTIRIQKAQTRKPKSVQ